MRRRDFLRIATGSLGALALDCGASRLRPTRTQPDVVVVGGGLAGLVVARRLRAHGVDAIVLEAGARAGGRVRTERRFDDGLFAEAGAHDLFEADTETFALVRELGLPLERWPRGDARTVVGWAGRRGVYDSAALSDAAPDGLTPEERRAFPDVLDMYLEAEVTRVRAAGRPTCRCTRDLDGERVSDFLARRGASPAAVEVVVRGLSVAPAEASVLWAAWEIVAVERRGSGRPWRIVGGNDRIPDALARELGEALHVGTPVRAIDRDPPRVVTGERTLHPRAIVVAIPLPAYAAVEMAGIDRRVREAAARIPQVAQSITHFQLRAGTRLESTVAIGDGPLAWTSAADGPAPGRRAILEGWSEVFGTSALDAATGGDALATSDLVRLFPEAAGAVERVRRVSWRGVAGIGGAGAYYGPGQVERYLSLLREPEPPVFFAGDHASDRPTWTVGAIRSAERAAEDVLRYLRRAAA